MTDTSTLKRALVTIQKLKQKLQEQNNKSDEPVAIIGLSCRVPEANNPQEFWDLLCQGKNIISRIPEERWGLLQETEEAAQRDPYLNYWGGYLRNITDFDAYFFGISPREALRMDPQQRILLEVLYEALEDAGVTQEAITGSNTGVFSSLYASQYSHLQEMESDMDALLIPTGSAISMAANRFSYLFDLRGPSMVLDTACSSSLIAIQLACMNLQAGLCDKALVSAVNINLLPSVHSILAKATMLSPTGQCHTFDAKADGYVQGEGAGAVLLKPLSKALADKNRIYAVIQGSAVNQDGKTNGLTAPNGLQQEQLLRDAYRAARIDPQHVSFIECHGTGTLLGDPIEVQALGEVIAATRDVASPCWISSVKTNIGHLEPAAGVLGLIKTAMTLRKGVMPPHLNYSKANPHIPFSKYALRIPLQMETIPRYGDVAIAGISGFGFGGANAHLVLREVKEQEQINELPEVLPEELVTLSAKDSAALSDLIQAWIDFLQCHPQSNLAALSYNVHVYRTHYQYRCAVIALSIDDLYEKLLDARAQRENASVYLSQEIKKGKKRIQIHDVAHHDLNTLAEHYINQAVIDWQSYEAGRFYRLVDMPLYPWQHKKYWPKFKENNSKITSCPYPMRGRALSSPLTTRQFEFILDLRHLPELRDTFHVAHAGYYLEMLVYAVKDIKAQDSFSVHNLAFHSPLLVLEGKTIVVQLLIDAQEQDNTFSFYSHDGNGNWLKHASGSLSLNPLSAKTMDAKQDLLVQDKQLVTAAAFYQRILNMGMPVGDTIRWVNQCWLGYKESFSELRLPKVDERGTHFMLQVHPGIIDACIQTLFLLVPDAVNKPYIASNMGQVNIYGPLTKPLFIYAQLKELDLQGKQIIGDWYLLDKHDSVIASCHNLCLTQLNDTMHIEHIMEIKAEHQVDFSLPYAECKKAVIICLKEQLSVIFAMPIADVNASQSMHDLGMDSLMALAVIRVIESNLGMIYSLPEIMKGPSIEEIADAVMTAKSTGKEKPTSLVTGKANSCWIAHRKKQNNATMRLFCFPFGGGGASIYREWQANFPDFIEVCPVQLPGRENRMDEEPLTHLDELIPLLVQYLHPEFDIPFVFFGHSFGALIAFELTRYLRRHQLILPVHLFVSAYPEPCKPSQSLHDLLERLEANKISLFDLTAERIGALDNRKLRLLSKIFRENGVVDYGDERMNQEIIRVLLPIFIADMKLVHRHEYHPEEPLPLNTTVFLGTKDTWVHPDAIWGWRAHSALNCDFRQFDSGHLFIREGDVRLQVIQCIVEALSQHMSVLV